MGTFSGAINNSVKIHTHVPLNFIFQGLKGEMWTSRAHSFLPSKIQPNEAAPDKAKVFSVPFQSAYNALEGFAIARQTCMHLSIQMPGVCTFAVA